MSDALNSVTLALKSLEARQRQASHQRIMQALKSRDANQIVLAAEALAAEQGPGEEQRVAQLCGLLSDDHEQVQIAGVEGLARINAASEKWIVFLAERLVSDSCGPDTAIAIVRALRGLGSRLAQAMKALEPVVCGKQFSEPARMRVVTILRDAGIVAAKSLCKAIVGDPSVEIRQTAAEGLVRITPGKVQDANIAAAVKHAASHVLRNETDAFVIDCMLKAAQNWAENSSRAGEKVEHNPLAESGKKVVAPRAEEDYENQDEATGEIEHVEGERRSARIAALLDAAAPASYPAACRAAREFLELSKQHAADLIQGPLNAAIRKLPHASYEDKKTLVSWVNGELRALGLAIRCPKTGRPAILVADIRGGGDESSRFRLEISDPDGRKVRTWTGGDFEEFHLQLRADEPRKEGATVRRERGGKI